MTPRERIESGYEIDRLEGRSRIRWWFFAVVPEEAGRPELPEGQ